jgi:hypothetical protein
MRDRNRLRKLQDRIIGYADRRNMTDATRVSERIDGLSVGDLRKFIFPEWETALRAVADDLGV